MKNGNGSHGKLDERPEYKYLLTAFILAVITGATDILTPVHLNVFPFYLISIFLIFNYGNMLFLPVIFVIAAVSMMISEYIGHNAIKFHAIWNAFMVMMMFIVFIAILHKLRSEQKIIRDQKKLLERELNEKSLLVKDLGEALNKVKTLKGLLPICSYCKKIRDDKGYWNQLEEYVSKNSDANFSHSICPDCSQKYYPDLDIYEDSTD